MNVVDVSQVSPEGESFVFSVAVGDFKYKVSCTKDYYQNLTGGKISPEQLVKKSFDFLLEREGPESILKEFDLPTIQKYFPDYEQEILK